MFTVVEAQIYRENAWLKSATQYFQPSTHLSDVDGLSSSLRETIEWKPFVFCYVINPSSKQTNQVRWDWALVFFR